ncbi:class IV adenylate cyclase [Dethiosulfatarculus sandiegensis]|nr:class IV adenylate cyclase [Dethiosulfatarculus sandiegensis]
MARNIEIKASISDLAYCDRKAKILAGTEPEIIKQEDIFFNCEKGKLKLRIFSKENGLLIFYNRPEATGPKTSEYYLSSTQEPHCLLDVLERAYGSCGKVKKIRKLYMIGRTRVHLDKVENLGNFLEFEVILQDGEEVIEGEKEAKQLMEAFNISETDLLSGAYIDMM